MCGVGRITTYFSAGVMLPLAVVARRFLGLGLTCRLLGVALIRLPEARSYPSCHQPLEGALEIHLIVLRVARRLPFKALCLPRSIVVCVLLSLAGQEGILKLSVKRVQGGIESHAWVECNQAPLGEPDPLLKDFEPFNN